MKTKICPRCGSIDTTIPPAGLDIKMSLTDYCRRCENRGIFPEVDMDDVEDFQKDLKNADK